MKKFILFLILPAMTATAQPDKPIDLDALYQQIDEAIRQSPQYVAERERQIAAYRDSLLTEKSAERSVVLAEKLFRLYEPYRNDSALHYAEVCISLADSLRRPGLAGRFRSMMAYQCSNTDLNTEALEQLRIVNRPALDSTGLADYYRAWMHVCGELGSYTQRKDVRLNYYDMQDRYRDSVLTVVGEGSDEWFHLKMDILNARQQFQDALELSDRWFQKVDDNTHESAYAAFYRSMVYDRLKNHDMTCYWLGKSALDDIRCGVMNQASLLFLAEHLADNGDISRALRYMEFAKDCNLAFSPRLRTYQVNPVINVIGKSNQVAQARAKLALITATVVIILLLAALIYTVLLLRKARHKEC